MWKIKRLTIFRKNPWVFHIFLGWLDSTPGEEDELFPTSRDWWLNPSLVKSQLFHQISNVLLGFPSKKWGSCKFSQQHLLIFHRLSFHSPVIDVWTEISLLKSELNGYFRQEAPKWYPSSHSWCWMLIPPKNRSWPPKWWIIDPEWKWWGDLWTKTIKNHWKTTGITGSSGRFFVSKSPIRPTLPCSGGRPRLGGLCGLCGSAGDGRPGERDIQTVRWFNDWQY